MLKKKRTLLVLIALALCAVLVFAACGNTLAELKETSKKSLDAYAAGKSESDYSAANWTLLQKAATDGKAAIDNAADEAAITKALTDAKAAIDAVKTKAQEGGDIAEKKTAAKTALDTYAGGKHENDYSSANWALIQKAVTDGKAAIDNAADEAAVDSALNTAKAAIDLIKTTAQEAAEALAKLKGELKTELEGYAADKTEGDYSAANWALIQKAVTDGKAAIDSAIDETAARTALSDAKAAIDAVKTIAQESTEALALLKGELKTELENYAAAKTEGDYSAANWALIQKAVTDGKAAIDSAADEAAARTALSGAKTAIDAVKTIAQEAAEALAKLKGELKTELENYAAAKTEGDYSSANWALIQKAVTDGKAAIDSAIDETAARTALSDAKAAIDAVKTTAQLNLIEAKTAAKAALGTAYDGYDLAVYSEEGKAALLKAKNDGIAAIDQAATTEAVTSAKEAALTAMADVVPIVATVNTVDELNAALLKKIPTITLGADMETGIEVGYALTLDLNGHKLHATEGAAVTVTAEGVLTIKDSGNNGLIQSEKDHGVINNGSLTVQSGIFDSKFNEKAALYNSGTAIISGGTFKRSLEAGANGNANGNSWYTVYNKGTLTLNGGEILGDGAYASTLINVGTKDNTANLNINGGKITSRIIAVKNDDFGKLIISDGEIVITEHAADKSECILNWAYCEITGGTFTDLYDVKVILNAAYENAGYENRLAISGGTFTACGADVITNKAYDNKQQPTLVVTGGDFKEKSGDQLIDVVYTEAQLKKLAGTSSYIKLGADIALEDVLTIAENSELTLGLNGHTLSIVKAATQAVRVNGKLTINDAKEVKGTVKGTVAAVGTNARLTIESGNFVTDDTTLVLRVEDHAEAVINGGSFDFQNVGDSQTNLALITVSGKLTVTGGTFKSAGYGFTVVKNSELNYGGTATTVSQAPAVSGNNVVPTVTINITGGSLKSTGGVPDSDEETAIYMPSYGTLNISGGTIEGAVALDVRMGNVNITGGILKSTKTQSKELSYNDINGITAPDGSAIIIHTNLYKSRIEGATSSFKISDEAFAAIQSASGVKISVYEWGKGGDFAYTGISLTTDLLKDAVLHAHVYTVENTMLFAAMTSSFKEVSLTLEQDIVLTETINVTAGSLILDLNGKQINGLALADAVKVGPDAKLVIKDSGSTGKVTAAQHAVSAIGEESKKALLTIEGGTFQVNSTTGDAKNTTAEAVHGEYADITITGGSYVVTGVNNVNNEYDQASALYLYKNSTANVTGGTFTSNMYGVLIFTNSSLVYGGNAEITSTLQTISGNNLYPSMSVTINGGKVTSTESTALYMPAQGPIVTENSKTVLKSNLTVTGGEITGLTALDARIGIINITGGTFTATGKKIVFTKQSDVHGDASHDGSAILIHSELYSDPNGTPARKDFEMHINAGPDGATLVSQHGEKISYYAWNVSGAAQLSWASTFYGCDITAPYMISGTGFNRIAQLSWTADNINITLGADISTGGATLGAYPTWGVIKEASEGTKVVLDLNGHVITSTQKYALLDGKKVDLTVKDGSVEKAGAIKNGIMSVTNGSNVIIENGSYSGSIYLGSGVITIQDGTFTDFFLEEAAPNAENAVTINGGDFTSVTGTENNMFEIRYAMTLTLNGGTFTAAGNGIVFANSTDTAITGKAVINDGVAFTAYGFVIAGNNMYPEMNVEINGGILTSTNAVAIYMPAAGNLTMTGGTVKGLAAIDARMGTIVITGGTLEATAARSMLTEKTQVSGQSASDGSAILLNSELYLNKGAKGILSVTISGATLVAKDSGNVISVYDWNAAVQTVTISAEGYKTGTHELTVDGVSYSQNVAAEADFASVIQASTLGGGRLSEIKLTLIKGFTLSQSLNLDTTGIKNGLSINLNGNTVTSSAAGRLINLYGGKLHVYGGQMVSVGEKVSDTPGTTSGSGSSGVFYMTKGELYLNDLTLTNGKPHAVNVKVMGGKAELRNVIINSTYGGGVDAAGGTIDLYDCNFTQTEYFDWNSVNIAVSYGGTANVHSGNYQGQYAMYVFSSGGNINVYGGTFAAVGGENNVGKNLIRADLDRSTYPDSQANLGIYGGTFSGTVYLHEDTNMEIGCAAGLEIYLKAAEQASNLKGNINLTADIDFEGKPFTPINNFSGVFDGQNHTVSGLVSELFAPEISGTVKNVTFTTVASGVE